jgi:hypothetical protein
VAFGWQYLYCACLIHLVPALETKIGILERDIAWDHYAFLVYSIEYNNWGLAALDSDGSQWLGLSFQEWWVSILDHCSSRYSSLRSKVCGHCRRLLRGLVATSVTGVSLLILTLEQGSRIFNKCLWHSPQWSFSTTCATTFACWCVGGYKASLSLSLCPLSLALSLSL